MRPIFLLCICVFAFLGCGRPDEVIRCALDEIFPLPTVVDAGAAPEASAAPEALGTTTQTLLVPNPISFRRYAGGGHGPGALYTAMECATTRILAATCIDIDLTIYPTSNMVRWEAAANMPNASSGYVWGDTWSTQRIKLSDGLTEPSFCTVLIHEMIHVLRRSYSHPGADGSMSHPVTRTFSTPISRITAEDITLICAKQTCGCNNPEPPVEG